MACRLSRRADGKDRGRSPSAHMAGQLAISCLMAGPHLGAAAAFGALGQLVGGRDAVMVAVAVVDVAGQRICPRLAALQPLLVR